MAVASVNENVRYEPNESPPTFVAVGAGGLDRCHRGADCRAAGLLHIVGVFAALIVSGAKTVLQAVRVGRLGAGHVLIMGMSGAFIAVCVAALVKGGPATMASLIVVSSLVQFALAARLSLLRRIFTPVVAGTVIMLIAATVMPIVFDSLTDVPDGTSQTAAPAAALATIVIVGPSCCAPRPRCGYGRLL